MPLTDIAGKSDGAVVRSGEDATRRNEESVPVLSDKREANTKPPLATGKMSTIINNVKNPGIIVTGYLFSKSAQAAEHEDRGGQIINIDASEFLAGQAHNVSLEGTMSLSNFDPFTGLISTMTINNVSFSPGSSTGPRYLFCFYLSDDPTDSNVTSGYETQSPPGSSASVARLTSDPIGQSIRYPFDTYIATVNILAAYQDFNTSIPLPPDPCRNYLIPRTAPDCSLTVQQSLGGWHASVSLLGQFNPRLQITVERDSVVIGLACLLFAVSWLLSLAVCFITIFVIWHKNEPRFDLVATCATLLFALPQLRSAQPGIPTTPILLDAIGYLWNIAIVGLSMLSLIFYFIARVLKTKNTKETAKGGCVDPEAESLLDNGGENV
ncbi:hypothetical protein B0H13DRAFT_1915041 [Mycena leptocephala]|nr:hypothetical protein B0H13DRAFT_1915041 [Mycena leptocephala]